MSQTASPPDPADVTSPAQFVQALRELRLWAGEPSLRRLRQLAGTTVDARDNPVEALPVSTISHVLRGDRLPRMDLVQAYVTGCLQARPSGQDTASYLERWCEAWRRLHGPEQSGQPEQSEQPELPEQPEQQGPAGPREALGVEAERTGTGAAGGPSAGPSAAVAAAAPVPRQLPPDVPWFTGRSDELAILRNAMDAPGPVVVSAIDGIGGVGKSALAIHAAHQLASRFPDGQLYADLRGASPGVAPADPQEVLGRFLRALGVPGREVPSDLDEAAARFRSELAGKRLLVMLDNARDERQIRPLLPGSPGCQALVTSRQALPGLAAAHPIHLDLLPEPDAVALLGRVVGADRMAAEPVAAAALTRRCGYLPLALRIAAARLVARPGWTVTDLVDRLAAGHDLGELRTGDLAVRACFDVSYQQLRDGADPDDRAAAEAFVRLGLWDGPDIGMELAARLLDREEAVAERALERLVDTRLLESAAPGRYRLHDLLRRYAHELVERTVPEAERLTVLEQVLDFYAGSASHAYRLLRPGDHRFGSDQPAGGVRFPDLPVALSWLEQERANLLALVDRAAEAPARLGPATVRLAGPLWAFFMHRGYWRDWEQVATAGLAVARQLGDRSAEAQFLSNLSGAAELRGDFWQAIAHQEQSLELRRALGDREGEARSLSNLAGVHTLAGRLDEAVRCGEHGAAIARELGNRRIEAAALQNLGVAYVRLGRYEEALASYQESLAWHRELGNDPGAAEVLGNLGTVYRQLDRNAEASDSAEQSLAIHRRIGTRRGEADCLANLGKIRYAQGRYPEAREYAESSLRICRELGHHRNEAESLRHAAAALVALGRAGQAAAYLRDALAIYQRLRLPEVSELLVEIAALDRRGASG